VNSLGWASKREAVQARQIIGQGRSLTAGSTGLQRDGLPGVRRWRRLPGRRFVIIHLRRRGRVDIDAAAEDERRQEQAEYKKSHAHIVFPPGLSRQRSVGTAMANEVLLGRDPARWFSVVLHGACGNKGAMKFY
jgi:hypothetical protein